MAVSRAQERGAWGHLRPQIRQVTVDESSRWLASGWADLLANRRISVGYGLIFVIAAWLLFGGLGWLGLDSLILPLAGGFLLVGPVAAVGLYEISHRREQGLPVSLGAALGAWRRNPTQIGMMGVLLLLAFIVWLQVALLIFAAFFGAGPPTLQGFLAEAVVSPFAVPFLMVGTVAGAVLAAIVFAISAVSLPMLVDREATVAEAVATSLRAVGANWRVMTGWAAMIALIGAVGLATFFIGLAVALPLLGHASWHAYRALVEF